VAAPFVEIGLLSGERCLCVLTSVQMELLRESLASKGMNPDREVSGGALLLATPRSISAKRAVVVQKDDCPEVLISVQDSTLSGAMRAVEMALANWA